MAAWRSSTDVYRQIISHRLDSGFLWIRYSLAVLSGYPASAKIIVATAFCEIRRHTTCCAAPVAPVRGFYSLFCAASQLMFFRMRAEASHLSPTLLPRRPPPHLQPDSRRLRDAPRCLLPASRSPARHFTAPHRLTYSKRSPRLKTNLVVIPRRRSIPNLSAGPPSDPRKRRGLRETPMPAAPWSS